MLKLVKKEFALAMHPITPVMLLLSAMVIIPNYPYVVMFFYITMAVFFTCLLGRENNDVIYSLNLPVGKRDVVSARIAFTLIIELAQLALMIPFTIISHNVNPLGNQAGMDANIALFGTGFIVYSAFNLVFFSSYYKDVNKVGVAFLKSSAVVFLFAALDPVSTYAIPFVRDALDTPDPAYLTEKLIYLATGIIIYALSAAITLKISVRGFEKQDFS